MQQLALPRNLAALRANAIMISDGPGDAAESDEGVTDNVMS